MASTLTPLDIINSALVKCGYNIVGSSTVSTENSAGNKMYYFLLESINCLTEDLIPDVGWNESEASTTTTANVSTVTLNSRVNTNIIHWVAIDTTLTRLARTTRLRLISETFPGITDPTETGKPSYFYIQDESLYLWKTPDAAYTITYGYQNLPQSFSASNISTTTLDVNDQTRAILINMCASRYLEMEGATERALILWKKTEDLDNPDSLIRKYRRNNKLMEKWSLRRMRPARSKNLGYYL